jgi:hypothetical protein
MTERRKAIAIVNASRKRQVNIVSSAERRSDATSVA